MSAPYTVQVERKVQKAIQRMHPRVARQVRDVISALATDPRPDGVKKGTNKPWYRVRVGDYRVLYTIDDGNVLVTVIKAAHRSEVYED